MPHKVGTIGPCLLGKLLSRNQTGKRWAVWLHCRRQEERGESNLSNYPRKGHKCPPPSYKLVGNTSNGRLFGSPLPSPGYPVLLVLVPWGKGRVAQSWDIQGVRLLEATVWDWDEVLSPLLQAGLASPPTEGSFNLSP